MNPPENEWVESDEFGEWSEPKRTEVPDSDFERYVRPSSRFRHPAKRYSTTDERVSKEGLKDHKIILGAARQFMEYADRLEKMADTTPVAKLHLTSTAEIFREKAWESLWEIMPIIDNKRSKITRRLSFIDLCEFSSALLVLRERYLGPKPTDSRKVIRSQIQSLYNKYGIRKTPKSEVEIKLDKLKSDRKKIDPMDYGNKALSLGDLHGILYT